jgi:hypothetical protein
MRAILELQAAGLDFSIHGDKISYRWSRSDHPDPTKVVPLLDEIKKNKAQALEYLLMKPGHCASCPARGHWDGYGRWQMYPGLYCFFFELLQGQGCPAGADRRGTRDVSTTGQVTYENRFLGDD